MVRKNMKYAALAVFSVAFVLGCTHLYNKDSANNNAQNRSVAYDSEYAKNYYGDSTMISEAYNNSGKPVVPEWDNVLKNDASIIGGSVEYPEGLNKEEVADLWHLSEGSDTFPLKWYLHLTSLLSSPVQNGKTKLYEKLDEKYGAIRESEKFSNSHKYALDYVGLTTAWSDAPHDNADVNMISASGEKYTLEQIQEKRTLPNGKTSIAMVGVNCTFCHSAEVKIDGKKSIVDGAPGVVNMRGYFQDLFGSTAKTMLTEDLMIAFLNDAKVPNAKKEALAFVSDIKRDLGLDNFFKEKFSNGITRAANGLHFLGLDDWGTAAEDFKKLKVKETFFKNKDIVHQYLVRLLKLTYGIQDQQLTNELNLRMKWLTLQLTQDPKLDFTPEGYSRTDAFGRIANMTARKNNPIPLTGTVSVPNMWRIKYKALYHMNGNTNSVLMRNIGQTFGLGAILLGDTEKDDFSSTSNMYNLNRLEHLLYKIVVPTWAEVSKEKITEAQIKQVVTGCNRYYESCARCHDPVKERVGPSKQLVLQKTIYTKEVGTDELYLTNQATPIGNTAFRDALFGFTRSVRDDYYKRYNVSEADRSLWERRELRGEEIFRDTYLGETKVTGETAYMNVPVKDKDNHPGYIAPLLAGVWATGPFLHNGSVPSIRALLTPDYNRPKIFFVGSSTINKSDLGFVSSPKEFYADLKPEYQQLVKDYLLKFKIVEKIVEGNINFVSNEKLTNALCKVFPERCYDTKVENKGNSNKGHNFGVYYSDENKNALIEFLKVMRPDAEFSRMQDPIYQLNSKVDDYGKTKITCEAAPRVNAY